MSEKKSCNYAGHEFGSVSYPDSMCVFGWLFDADNCDEPGTLNEPSIRIPCPKCNPDGKTPFPVVIDGMWAEPKKAPNE